MSRSHEDLLQEAVRRNLLTADQATAALAAWRSDPSQSLPDLLAARGAMSAADGRKLLAALSPPAEGERSTPTAPTVAWGDLAPDDSDADRDHQDATMTSALAAPAENPSVGDEEWKTLTDDELSAP